MRRQKLGIISNNLNVNSETLGYNPNAEKGNTDHHSGFYLIESGETIEVERNKQMTSWGGLLVDGILEIDGQLIIE